jgi:hypothetical protein
LEFATIPLNKKEKKSNGGKRRNPLGHLKHNTNMSGEKYQNIQEDLGL